LRPAPSTARKHTVSGSVALPSPGFFSPFPHGTVRYRSLCVVSLGEWAPLLQTGLLVSGPTQVPILAALLLTNPALTVSGGVFQTPYVAALSCEWTAAAVPDWPCNPVDATPAGLTRPRFGLIPVRSPLLRDFFRFLGVHEMFQFPRFPPACAGHQPQLMGLPHSEMMRSSAARASRILIAALPRPSSAHSAKAFTLCSFCLPGRNRCCPARHGRQHDGSPPYLGFVFEPPDDDISPRTLGGS
jgi:hypothetical protein